MVTPSTLNVLIIGLSVIVFAFLWRMLAAKLADSENPSLESVGGAMATIL